MSTAGSATLTVSASNATAVAVKGSDGSSYTLASSGGTQVVSVAATTTYTATATGTGGNATATATVTVGSTAAAPMVSISANPATIGAGGSSTLTVTASNATTVSIAGSDGSKYSFAATGGTQSVTPSATTTYSVSAVGPGGSASATATVTVGQATPSAATVSISANPAAITAGGSSILTVTAANASQVAIKGSDGTSYTMATAGGTQAVSPSATTTYSVTATGAGGSATAAATVTVGQVLAPAPTVTLTASPTSILAGTASTLTAVATNATSVAIAGSDGSSYTLAATGGTQSVTPSANTTYTVTASGAGGNVSATATVTVTEAAPQVPTISISANPMSIKAGSTSTLSVNATNATSVVVTGSDASSYTLTATGGTQSVTPSTTTTYTATATGVGGKTSATATVTVTAAAPTVTALAGPSSIASGSSATLTVTATGATTVTVSGSDGTSYTLPAAGGTQVVSPTATTTYTVTAIGSGGSATASATVTVTGAGSLQAVQHVIFMLQENHTFDNYFGMLNPYRDSNGFSTGDDGVVYHVDGIDSTYNNVKNLTNISNQDDEGDVFHLYPASSTCVDDMSSDWLASYGDVNRYDVLQNRPINMDGFVHNAEGYANSCLADPSGCSGTFNSEKAGHYGQRAMGYYDQNDLNYYYYIASQFALSDRWFSPVSSKSIDNRIATFTGGTTQGLVSDPGADGLSQLAIPTIFSELENATPSVSWKVYYTVSQGFCTDEDDCGNSAFSSYYPASDFENLQDSYKYVYVKQHLSDTCSATTQGSSVVGDASNSFCIDINHIVPLVPKTPGSPSYFTDLANGTLPQFAFIEAGYANSDEHPGSGQSILVGEAQVANVINSLMASSSWKNSIFFLAYDEGGGPYDHVPPVPGSSNINTNTSLGTYPDIGAVPTIAVNPDAFNPCLPETVGVPTTHCDLVNEPGEAQTGTQTSPFLGGFKAQLGFRVPNMIISPFTRRHYVGHTPMDHTAVIKFVENRFIGPNAALTARDAVQPNLLDFFDFNNPPWETPPASTPTPPMVGSSCQPAVVGPQ
jgi:phospholipase C